MQKTYTMTVPEFYTVNQFAKVCKVQPQAVYRWLKTKTVPSNIYKRIGKGPKARIRFYVDRSLKWFNAQ